MKPMRKQQSLEQLVALFKRFHESKLSLADFAYQQHLPYSTLLHYKKRLLKADLFPLPSSQKTPSSPLLPSFFQLFPPPLKEEQSLLFVRYGSFELHLSEGFNPALLKQVLEVLKLHA
jgi:hypothetical protein